MDICTVKGCKNEVRYEGSFVCEEHTANYKKTGKYKSIKDIQQRINEIIEEKRAIRKQ